MTASALYATSRVAAGPAARPFFRKAFRPCLREPLGRHRQTDRACIEARPL